MTVVRAIAYHLLAAIATLGQLAIGILVLFMTALTAPPDREGLAIVAKTVLVLGWAGLFIWGLIEWSRRSWVVIGVPFVSLVLVWVVGSIAQASIDWYLNWGY